MRRPPLVIATALKCAKKRENAETGRIALTLSDRVAGQAPMRRLIPPSQEKLKVRFRRSAAAPHAIGCAKCSLTTIAEASSRRHEVEHRRSKVVRTVADAAEVAAITPSRSTREVESSRSGTAARAWIRRTPTEQELVSRRHARRCGSSQEVLGARRSPTSCRAPRIIKLVAPMMYECSASANLVIGRSFERSCRR